MSLALRDGQPIGGDDVTAQKAVVEKYTDGFRKGDLAQIVSCLTDDVVWAFHGAKTLVGKDAFAAEADSVDGPIPELTLDRMVEEGDTVAVIGHGSGSMGGDLVDFVYSEVFTFTDGLVSRLDTFHIWLGAVPA
ncbi:MAG: nuclear transport factor 2 family protein [Myxococcales bacterium]